MPHAFDPSALRHLVGGFLTMAELAHDQERRLAELLAPIEAAHQQAALPLPDTAPVGPLVPAETVTASIDAALPPRLPVIFRELCATVREQQLLAEHTLARIGIDRRDADTTRADAPGVLVVDDSDDNRNLAAEVLNSYGFRVTTAANGLEALLAAHWLMPAAILMDMTMPILTGIEAARLLRASPVTRDIGLVAYTANADLYDGVLRQFFTDVLIKPADPEAIARRVRRVCARHETD